MFVKVTLLFLHGKESLCVTAVDGEVNKNHCVNGVVSNGTYIDSSLGVRGPGSVVGIATGYGLESPGIESR